MRIRTADLEVGTCRAHARRLGAMAILAMREHGQDARGTGNK